MKEVKQCEQSAAQAAISFMKGIGDYDTMKVKFNVYCEAIGANKASTVDSRKGHREICVQRIVIESIYALGNMQLDKLEEYLKTIANDYE